MRLRGTHSRDLTTWVTPDTGHRQSAAMRVQAGLPAGGRGARRACVSQGCAGSAATIRRWAASYVGVPYLCHLPAPLPIFPLRKCPLVSETSGQSLRKFHVQASVSYGPRAIQPQLFLGLEPTRRQEEALRPSVGNSSPGLRQGPPSTATPSQSLFRHHDCGWLLPAHVSLPPTPGFCAES